MVWYCRFFCINIILLIPGPDSVYRSRNTHLDMPDWQSIFPTLLGRSNPCQCQAHKGSTPCWSVQGFVLIRWCTWMRGLEQGKREQWRRPGSGSRGWPRSVLLTPASSSHANSFSFFPPLLEIPVEHKREEFFPTSPSPTNGLITAFNDLF